MRFLFATLLVAKYLSEGGFGDDHAIFSGARARLRKGGEVAFVQKGCEGNSKRIEFSFEQIVADALSQRVLQLGLP